MSTTEQNDWPAPTLGKSLMQLKEQRDIATEYLKHLNREIPIVCGKQGHVWDNPEGEKDYIPQGYHEESGRFLVPGAFVETHSLTVFVRTCKVCGAREKQEARETSPFTPDAN